MIRNKSSYVLGSLLACMLAVWLLPATAGATVYSSPVRKYKEGDMAIALGLSDYKETIILDFALTPTGTLSGFAGNISDQGISGSEIGIGYHLGFGQKKFNNKNVDLGGFAMFSTGSFDIGFDNSYTEINLGGGGSMVLTKEVNGFGSVIYRRSTFEVLGFSVTDSDVGFALGGEYIATPELRLSLELHVGFTAADSFGLYASYKF